MNTIPKEKLILLDKLVPGVTGKFSVVYENFEKDIFNALEQALDKLKKYLTIKIIFPEGSYFPIEILNGFEAFCTEYHFNSNLIIK